MSGDFLLKVIFPGEKAAVFDDRIPYEDMKMILSHKEFGDPEKLKLLEQEKKRRDDLNFD